MQAQYLIRLSVKMAITSRLLEFAKRSTFVIIKSYTFNTKITFPPITFPKISSFKMFPKCSLDVPNIATLREHSANIPAILRAGWEGCFVPLVFSANVEWIVSARNST